MSAPTLVQSNAAAGTAGTSTAVTLTGVTAGNMLIAYPGSLSQPAIGVSDPNNGSYVQDKTSQVNYLQSLFRVMNALAGNTTITAAWSGTFTVDLIVEEWNLGGNTLAIDTTGSNSSTAATSTSVSLTTTQNNDLILYAAHTNVARTQTAGAGYTQDAQTVSEMSSFWSTANSSGANTASSSWTTSAGYEAVAVAYKLTATTVIIPGKPHRLHGF